VAGASGEGHQGGYAKIGEGCASVEGESREGHQGRSSRAGRGDAKTGGATLREGCC